MEFNVGRRWTVLSFAGLVVVGLTMVAMYGTDELAGKMALGLSATNKSSVPASLNDYRTTSPIQWLTNKQKQMVEDYKPGTGAEVPCHEIGDQYLGTDLPYVPIPKSWCNKCTADGETAESEEPNYIFVMGDPDSGTTALHGTLLSSSSVTHLCRTSVTRKDGLTESHNEQCEGHKIAIPDDEWDRRWEEDAWPYDFQADVLDKYEARWHHDRCFRADKSPPYSIRVFQIVQDLITVHQHRVAFLILTRSRCQRNKGQNTYINLYAQQYQYLLDNQIPVLHVRYEDLYKDVSAVERRVNNWAQGCLDVDFSVGYDAVDGFDPKNSTLKRMEPVTEYIEGRELVNPVDVSLISRDWLAGLAYFGYKLVPRDQVDETKH